MKNVFGRIGGGAACAAVSLILYIAVLLLTSPALASIATSVVLPAVVAIAAIIFVVQKFPSFLASVFDRVIEGLLAIMTLIALALFTGLLCFLIGKLVKRSIEVLNGQAVDMIGTVIDLGPWSVFALYASVLVATICFVMHVVIPFTQDAPRFPRMILNALLSLVTVLVIGGVTAGGIYTSFVDKGEMRRSNIVRNIENLQKELSELDKARK